MKAAVTLGHTGRKAITLDLPTLLRTRLLVTANSGGGKSWLLRRIAEQLFGKVQVLVVDPEGEFASLREKYGYVLVGKGGETPADIRSASLVARKLLELKASAVCDLFEMKPKDRHTWVRLFLDALIDAPKGLWHPVVVIVDEAQMFAPEKGQGESEAAEAMMSLASKGRKRGFGAILATQRLSRLNKNVSAQMLNRLIGMHFEDVDVDRALDLLSIAGKTARLEAAQQMRTFDPGTFWAFGRALCLERMLFQVGSIETTHPDVGVEVQVLAPPPAPEKVRKLLPALADLPAQAEAEIRDLTAAQRKIAELERQLRARPVQVEPKLERVIERIEIPIFKDGDLSRLEKAVAAMGIAGEQLQVSSQAIAAGLRAASARPAAPPVRAPVRAAPASAPRPAIPAVAPTGTRNSENGKFLKAERSILTVLAQYPEGRSKVQLAILAGYSVKGGGFNNAIGALRRQGLLVGDKQQLQITDAGVAQLGFWERLPTGRALIDYWLRELPKAERSILAVLVDVWPEALTKEELAERAGYEPTGGGFNNALGKLRTLELIKGKGELSASETLFDG